MSSRTNRSNKEQTLNKIVKSIKRIINKNNYYERIVDESVVSFLKEKHLMRASSS